MTCTNVFVRLSRSLFLPACVPQYTLTQFKLSPFLVVLCISSLSSLCLTPSALLLAKFLTLGLGVSPMPVHHDPQTSKRICGCSTYCKWPVPVLLAMFYRHAKYREFDHRE